jgi:acetyl-CoA carboxylase biotin carboxyl carrier protein
MDLRKVKKLIELLESSNLAEIEVSEGDDSVRITRYSAAAPAAPATVNVAPCPPSGTTATPATAAAPDVVGNLVKSPMVGTMYYSSSPEAEPYVKIGDKVSVGDTVCIIEAMKMFNPIETDVAGTILEVIANDGHAVEYGQPLFLIG